MARAGGAGGAGHRLATADLVPVGRFVNSISPSKTAFEAVSPELLVRVKNLRLLGVIDVESEAAAGETFRLVRYM